MKTMTSQVVFFACGLGIIGLILVLAGVLGLRRGWSSRRWPSVSGQIISGPTSDGLEHPTRPEQPAIITYKYTVKGIEYTGHRISIEDAAGLPGAQARKAAFTNHYPSGKLVNVYYDPSDPARAVLQTGAGWAGYLPLAGGGLLFIISLIAMMFAFV